MAVAVFLVLLPILVTATAPAASADSSGEKTTHIKLYWHDVVTGPNPTTVIVAHNISDTYFGDVTVIDDPLSEGPDLNTSKLLGRAQGMYIGVGKDEAALLMKMNFVFQEGSEYNGSTLAIFGHNAIFTHVREMPIVGGTGVFRMAPGYAQLRTHMFNTHNANAIIEYNLYIKHWDGRLGLSDSRIVL